MKKHTNNLSKETSPYLLQHQHNPVHWFPWGDEALALAKSEDKPILVSIGYSACHWCHVMERESFENENLAEIMNSDFVCIKVDREERPDIDQIYMDAVQAMGLNGGWPLNVFLTPDQKPFYGGTYFPPASWGQILENVAEAFRTKRERLEESADNFVKAISTSDIQKYAALGTLQQHRDFDPKSITIMGKALASNFDLKYGGMNRAPKFPMPSIWRFLLRYYYHTEDPLAQKQLLRTLDGMAQGGIYDQAGGGFARYSVDERWFAPHFEKMLYDNGQLLTLYAEAYQLTKKPLYKNVLLQTIDWLKQELTSPENAFYAALDADSEGVEGKYYTWTSEEISQMAGTNVPLINAYYHITPTGNWEDGRNILYWTENDEDFAESHEVTLSQWLAIKKSFIETAMEIRKKRVKPGLDDKVLSGWNGIMLKGLVDTYNALGDETILSLAIANGQFIVSNMVVDGVLYRTYKDGRVKIEGYLEDYAFVAEAMIALYEATFEPSWLQVARDLADTAIAQFYDAEEKFFFYTSSQGEKLITRKKEVFDNVIPSSNAGLGHALFKLGKILDHEPYLTYASDMVSALSQMMLKDVQYLSHWALLYCDLCTPTAEISIVGPSYLKFRSELSQSFIPNKIVMGAENKSHLPLLENRLPIDGKTTLYVCYDKTCKLPVYTVNEALMQLQ